MWPLPIVGRCEGGGVRCGVHDNIVGILAAAVTRAGSGARGGVGVCGTRERSGIGVSFAVSVVTDGPAVGQPKTEEICIAAHTESYNSVGNCLLHKE